MSNTDGNIGIKTHDYSTYYVFDVLHLYWWLKLEPRLSVNPESMFEATDVFVI